MMYGQENAVGCEFASSYKKSQTVVHDGDVQERNKTYCPERTAMIRRYIKTLL